MSSMSKKQKIDTRSSTEAEIVGADDAMPQSMWMKYFIEVQGQGISENILYQDNLSTMLLVKNGKQSSSKRTKHIRVRYFCIKNKFDSGDLAIKHCPTEDMIGDYFTKSLQGALFHKFRAEVQGIPTDLSNVELGWDREGKMRELREAPPILAHRSVLGKLPRQFPLKWDRAKDMGSPILPLCIRY
jgi:hypothetical protein